MTFSIQTGISQTSGCRLSDTNVLYLFRFSSYLHDIYQISFTSWLWLFLCSCVAHCCTAWLYHYQNFPFGPPRIKNCINQKFIHLKMEAFGCPVEADVGALGQGHVRVQLIGQQSYGDTVKYQWWAWWLPREHTYQMALWATLLHRCSSKESHMVLSFSTSHCFSRLGCCGKHHDGEKMSIRDGSWLALDMGILSLGSWDDKAAVWRHSVEAIFHL